MMDEFAIDDLDRLGTHILEKSQAGLARGDPQDQAGRLQVHDARRRLRQADRPRRHHDDRRRPASTSTSPAPRACRRYGINVPFCYTEAYASFGVKCIVAPKVPNNEGSLSVIRITAPEDCILNAKHPAPVATRHVTGQMLPDVMFGCLHQALGGGVPAEGTLVPVEPVRAGRPRHAPTAIRPRPCNAIPFNVMSFHAGGTGARPGTDGLSATAFPSGVRNVPVEVNEAMSPLVIWTQGVPPGFRRRRRVPRRPRPDHGGRHARHGAVRASAPTTTASTIRRAAATAARTAWPARSASPRARSCAAWASRPCRRTTA